MGGKTIFLNRSDINTDEIIPAKYLTEVDKKALAPYILEDLKLEGFDPQAKEVTQSKVVVSRSNFGCGSSREHAVWVFTENNYQVIIAENFARIFRQNAYNSGLLAIELPKNQIDEIFNAYQEDHQVEILADLEKQTLEVKNSKKSFTLPFDISPFYKDVVKVGGWINYASKKY